MSEELNKPMPHAERQALVKRLKAEGVDLSDDVKNHVVNGGASAQEMLSREQVKLAAELDKAALLIPSKEPQASTPAWWVYATPAFLPVLL